MEIGPPPLNVSASDVIAITIGIQLDPNIVVLGVEPVVRNSADPHLYTVVIRIAGGYYVHFRYYDYAVIDSRKCALSLPFFLHSCKPHNAPPPR